MYNSSRDPNQLVSHGLNAGDVTTKFSVYITLHLTRSLILSPLAPTGPGLCPPQCRRVTYRKFPTDFRSVPPQYNYSSIWPSPPPECTLRDHLSSSPSHPHEAKDAVQTCVMQRPSQQYLLRTTCIHSKTFGGNGSQTLNTEHVFRYNSSTKKVKAT